MKVLFCHPAAEFSVSDVARGYRRALVKAGHDVRDYNISARMRYHAKALGEKAEDLATVSKQASETILLEAMYHGADLVFIVSALIFHPVAIALLRMARVPTAILHTESPYEDDKQAEWNAANENIWSFTHDSFSAETRGWGFLPHAYDPEIHRPTRTRLYTSAMKGGLFPGLLMDGEDPGPMITFENDPVPGYESDVLFIGTGWQERISFFESIDWTGINLRLLGLWPALSETSPLRRFYTEGCVDNEEAVKYYRSAKICLNFHRAHPDARSLNPRGYELAATGAFTLTDVRSDGVKLFGDSQPTFSTAEDLSSLVRKYLADPEARRRCAVQARACVKHETFDTRVAALFATLQSAAAK